MLKKDKGVSITGIALEKQSRLVMLSWSNNRRMQKTERFMGRAYWSRRIYFKMMYDYVNKVPILAASVVDRASGKWQTKGTVYLNLVELAYIFNCRLDCVFSEDAMAELTNVGGT